MTEIQSKERTAEDILSYLIIDHGLTSIDPFERAYCLYTAKEVLELIIKELEYAYRNNNNYYRDNNYYINNYYNYYNHNYNNHYYSNNNRNNNNYNNTC